MALSSCNVIVPSLVANNTHYTINNDAWTNMAEVNNKLTLLLPPDNAAAAAAALVNLPGRTDWVAKRTPRNAGGVILNKVHPWLATSLMTTRCASAESNRRPLTLNCNARTRLPLCDSLSSANCVNAVFACHTWTSPSSQAEATRLCDSWAANAITEAWCWQ